MKKHPINIVLILMLIISNLSIVTVGEEDNGSLSGIITNKELIPIENAKVRITCGNLNFTDYSDEDGFYYIDNIPIVDCYWNVSVYKSGYKIKYYELSIDENTTHNFVLNISNKIYVDDDNTRGPWDGSIEHPYQYIQQGIDSASNNETVFVLNGEYFENLSISKQIHLQGKNKLHTIINGGLTGQPGYKLISIESSNVLVSGFTLNNSKYGIHIQGASASIIYDNNIVNMTTGIQGSGFNHEIKNNEIYASYNAISLIGSSKSSISNNKLVRTEKPYQKTGVSVNLNGCNNIEMYMNEIHGSVVLIESNRNSIIYNNMYNELLGGPFFYYNGIFYYNYWDHNYWDDWNLPLKPVFGYILRVNPHTDWLDKPPIQWYHFDWHPAKEPYEI